MMDEAKVIRLMNEVLANRTITGVGFNTIGSHERGDRWVPYFDVDNQVRMLIGCIVPRDYGAREMIAILAQWAGGRLIEGVVARTVDGPDPHSFPCVVVDGKKFPVHNYSTLLTCELSDMGEAIASRGFQVPSEVWNNNWFELQLASDTDEIDSDDDEDEEEDDGDVDEDENDL